MADEDTPEAAGSEQKTSQLPSESERENGTEPSPSQDAAAQTIQRNYRGYKTRREFNGMGLSASSRWVEAVKEAQYRNLTTPRPRGEAAGASGSSTFAQQEWKHAKGIAERAYDDDTSDGSSEQGLSDAELAQHRRQKAERKKQREDNSKAMGLEYFLEMVDQKHRYGSHLRKYHAVWKQTDTNENFFYWLDEGEGRGVEVPACSREQLDRDQVRYLSREERLKYLVEIDGEGRLYYAKNGNRVTTSPDYKDSMEGIVHKDDPTPAYREDTRFPSPRLEDSLPRGDYGSDEESSSDSSSDSSAKDGQHRVSQELEDAKGIQKLQYVSAGALLHHKLKKAKTKNSWIFVADTSHRLYIGIKQSGAFQHSSFLRGARIAAAGQIKVQHGQLRRLSPLSGHYRPPPASFRAFVASLKARGADTRRVSFARSYAVLLGLEGYLGAKRAVKDGRRRAGERVERVFRPEDAARRREAREDKSESARREREVLEEQRGREDGLGTKLTRRFRADEPEEQ